MVERAAARRPDYRHDEELAAVDPDVSLLIGREEARQVEKLIMIPSESIAPHAVRVALGSVFTNIYAEGYPALRMRREEAAYLREIEEQLALHRRYADRRFYKGTELVDLVEALAQRRVAGLFATDRVPAGEIFANVQPLSGAAANNAVYEALLRPGDKILGLALSHGGHLTHGSPYNRSGRYYQVAPYTVNPRTGRLDYGEIHDLALEHHPRLVVAGASAYPWDIDWAVLRAIADEVGALLLADIAHPAGLVVAGLFPNPVGHAHAVTFTTHKTLCGPRGAVILTTDESLARKIDRAVFPGEQGGPHVNNIAAMAVAFRIAETAAFRALQRQVVANAQALATALKSRGLKLVYGGTNTHMLLVDLNALPSASGHPVKGDAASRILDIAGIVGNKNTIPGDASAAQSSGLRFGTVWATQRGLREPEMARLGELIHRALAAIVPFRYFGPDGDLGRGKLPFGELQAVRSGVAELIAALPDSGNTPHEAVRPRPLEALEIGGPRARLFLQEACAADLLDLAPGQTRRSTVLDPAGGAIAEIEVGRLADDSLGRERYAIEGKPDRLAVLRAWLEALSDGYVVCDDKDVYAKVEGPIVVAEAGRPARAQAGAEGGMPVIDPSKPYFVGQRALLAQSGPASRPKREEFPIAGYDGPPRRSCLYEEHVRLNNGRNMVPFAGWIMPVWYTSIREEHRAVRQAAGLFDISHMGVLEIKGPGAGRFLDLITTNYVPLLTAGQSHYSYILDIDGNVIDDVFLYCRAADRYMLVVNAANAERVESWLHAVNSRAYLIDRERPGVALDARAEIRSLKNPALGDEGRVDVALQGPRSLEILLATLADTALARAVARLGKTEFVEGLIAGIPALISRTGYTGEDVGFEIYVPPDRAPELWRLLLEQGEPFGIRPAGLGARDSTRAEAGFPLYGHELAGPYQISPVGAGYGHFVKLHKPFFVGRSAMITAEGRRSRQVVRFRLRSKAARVLRTGDPVVDQRGECIGHVTSSVVVDGVQVGMAYLAREEAIDGAAIWVFPLSRLKNGLEKPKAQLTVGDNTLLPEEGVILARFGLPVDSSPVYRTLSPRLARPDDSGRVRMQMTEEG